MYNIHLTDYIPSPDPATPLYPIVAAHYYPSWVKKEHELHPAFEGLHDFPERTPLCGYYDGSSPVFADLEIKWALEHGVNCFIYCWYRKKENMGKPVTADDLRLGETLHDGFFAAHYNKMMKFALMYEAQNRWGGTDADDLVNNLMPFWLDNYFMRSNYLVIDNKPVLFVYDYQHQVRDAFENAEAQKKAFDACRDMARAHGFDGMIFAVEYRHDDLAAWDDYKARGYDFSFAYCWGLKGAAKSKEPDDIRSAQMQKMTARAAYDPCYFVPTASCMWDPSPRYITMPQMYKPDGAFNWKLPPKDYRVLLERISALTDTLPEDAIGRKLVMLDNWNEWDEGHYLLPSAEDGFGYLQAVREAWTKRDNLPDYRMVEDYSCLQLNTMWSIPDFSK